MAELAIGQGHLDHKEDTDFDFDLDGEASNTSHTAGDDFDLELDDQPDVPTGHGDAILDEAEPTVIGAETDVAIDTINPTEDIEGPSTGSEDYEVRGTVDAIEYEEQAVDSVEVNEDEHADRVGQPPPNVANQVTMQVDEISYEDEVDEPPGSSLDQNVTSMSENAGPAQDDDEIGYGELLDNGQDNDIPEDDGYEEDAPQEEATIYFDAVANTNFINDGPKDINEQVQRSSQNEPSGTADSAAPSRTTEGQPTQAQHSHNDNNGNAVVLPPEVKVIYQQEEYSLFPSKQNHDPDTYFLSNYRIIEEPLSRFLACLRDVVSNEVSINDEVVIRVDELGLEFGEVRA